MVNIPLKNEFSAGGIVFRKNKGKIELLLGKHSGYHKWVLPKGLVEEEEDPKDTAVREVEEEIGVKARIIDPTPLKEIRYFYFADFSEQTGIDSKGRKTVRRVIRYQEEGGKKVKVQKRVVFYLMKYLSGDPNNHGWEMEDAGWFPYSKALSMLAFNTEKEALKEAKKRFNI